jgi:hypothetical protein
MVPPSQRQQALQSPVWSHWQHALWTPVPVQHAGHEVVTPSQVTCPGSDGQLELTPVQMMPEQLIMLPSWQATTAMQSAFPVRITGCLAAWRTPLGCAAQELAAGWLRIAARASWEREGGLWGVWAKAATETRRREQARIDVFFISSSFQLFFRG